MKTTFSRRELYALGEPIGNSATIKKLGGGRIYGMGGGGSSGGPMQTTSTSYQTNIPEYAQPYVETMLGATQKQLFQGTPTEGGGFDITGFQPYKAYGGTYDAEGNQTSYDPSKGIAGFQPMQTRAQEGISNMQTPSQFGQAMDVTGAGIGGALGTAGQGVGLSGLGYETANVGNRYAQQATNPNAMQSYMSPYMQNVVDVQQREAQRQADIAGTQRNAQAVQAGAFGGSRQAIMDAEAARNLSLQKGDIQATGLQSAYKDAQQAQQYGANLDLQGRQAGMQGVGAGIGAQQAGYGQMISGAQNLAGLGQQQLASQQGIYNLQNTMGAQQQALEQQKINQAMQDYANAQQYPLMQLGTMSNMVRGLPMQAQNTQQYVAQPNTLTQAIGAAGTGASLYNAFNPASAPAKAKGGIISYDVGGEVESDLENMDEEGLQKQLKESSSPSVKRMAQRILRERQLSKAPGMAGGGIIAFKEPTEENNQSLVTDEKPVAPPLTASQILQQRILQGEPVKDITKNPVGIMQAAPATATPASAPKVEDTLGNLPPLYKSMYEKADATSKKSRQEIAAELKAEAGPNLGAEEQRAKVMAERVNTEDEARRNRHLRAAEFFSTWGSTPGPTLIAGMSAVKANVANIISDEKEAKRIRMEIDKSIYALDEAARLEDKGFMDKAESIKEKQAANMMKVNEFLVRAQEDQVKIAAEHKKQADLLIGQAQIHKDDALSRATTSKEVAEIEGRFRREVANIQGAFGIREAGIRATAQGKSDTSRERHYDQSSVDKLFGEERKALSDIDKIKRDPDVSRSMTVIEMAKDPKNNIPPEQVAIAKKLLDEKLGDAPARLEGIRTERQRIQDRLSGKTPSSTSASDPLGIF
jgi:hypothetical protein